MYEEYALIEKEYRVLEKKRDDLRSLILNDLVRKAEDKMESGYGTFTVAHKLIYQYTDRIKELEAKVKIAKMREEKKGSAKFIKTTYLIFNEKKT